MGEFEEKLNSILSSPEDMEKIMNLARSLSSSAAALECTLCANTYMNTLISKSSLQARYPTSFSAINILILPLMLKLSRKKLKKDYVSFICMMFSVPTDVSLYTLWRPESPSVI